MRNLFLNYLKYILAFLLISTFDIFADDPPVFKYIGAEACGKCHKSEKQGKQYETWKESLHANAYKILLTDEAKKIAAEKGFDKSPNELVDCLVCHASGYDVTEERIDKGFNIEDGVQCETCHGAGSEYKSIKIMKDRKLAIQNGLLDIYGKTEEHCTGCHNPNSPTFSGFEFETMWKKIEHNLPVKKIEN